MANILVAFNLALTFLKFFEQGIAPDVRYSFDTVSFLGFGWH